MRGQAAAAAAGAACVVALVSGVLQGQAPERRTAARDAVYTAVQASRGSDQYATACAHCHATDLQGDVRKEIPSLAEGDFLVRWANRSLGELYGVISKDMPADRKGSLSPRAYADIVAYILSVNGFPAGAAELPADPAALAPVTVGTK